MQPTENVINCYNTTASQYANKFFHELEHKHADRLLLRSFAQENKEKGRMIDLGCGPGQTTDFLANCGITDIVGTDLSPAMIEEAKKLSPQLAFETADMLQLNYPDNSFGSAVAFYAIVHFDEEQLTTALNEIYRVIKSGSQFLFSFHTGTDVVHMDTFLDQQVSIDFYFWETNKVTGMAKATGFNIVDVLERHPYAGVEYQSVRAYAWLEKP